MSQLAAQACKPCRGDEEPLAGQELKALHEEIPAWDVVERNGVPRLKRSFDFKNFAQALAFTNQVGEMAEAENHHPKIVTEWGRVTMTWWTHSIGGLHRNDFILAARTDQLYGR